MFQVFIQDADGGNRFFEFFIFGQHAEYTPHDQFDFHTGPRCFI